MTATPDFPAPDDDKQFPDEDLSGLDFDLPDDFVVPDDISELEAMGPATHHEDPDGTQWDDPDWLAKGNSTLNAGGVTGSREPDTSRHPARSPEGTELQDLPALPNFDNDELPRNSLADFIPANAGDSRDLDSELAEITGDAYELAVLLTPVADAKALAAACALVGLEAIAVPNPSGAVAVLRNTAGDAPEKAAAALSGLLPSFPVLLITKATGQLNAIRYLGGQPPQEVPAGLVVAGASGVVEDLIIGQTVPTSVPGAISSAGVSRTKAMMWLSKIARHRRQK